MAEHHELVAEMAALEQMGTQERQKLAKKRRLQQLKKWAQREKEWIAKEKQLNKWLANMLNEDNNGLNLKQYTTYSSNGRSKGNKTKKQLQSIAALPSSTGGNSNNTNNSNCNNSKEQATNGKSANANNNNNNNDNDLLNNNHSICSDNGDVKATRFTSKSSGPKSEITSLAPNGHIHFNVGVMLLEAAARNDYDEVKRLLILGVSPDSVNHDGLTALHQCCIDASEPMMRLLLEFDANIDARDTEQWTPLHAACTCGHLNLVKILVQNGADLLAVNGDGNMPFDTCEDETTLDYIESQMVEQGITQEMIDFTRASTEMQMISDLEKQVTDGKDLNASDKNGVTQLHIAAANGYISVVKFLLKRGVNVNVCDNDQWRPLHGAGCWGNEQHCKIVELLIEAGADINAKTVNDETVFDLCDNAELLEKLNQLKDELESKQASGADRLRRTQSRTNSRVHSVRRTSVRDKNQISRREAREEALLRVENSPLSSNGETTTAGDATELGSAEGASVIDSTASNKQTSEKASLDLTSTSPINQPMDQVDGSSSMATTNGHHHKNNSTLAEFEPSSIKQTNLDGGLDLIEADSSDLNTKANNNSNGNRSQSSSAHTSNESIAAKRKHLMIRQANVVDESGSDTMKQADFLSESSSTSQQLANQNSSTRLKAPITSNGTAAASSIITPSSTSSGQSHGKTTKVNIVNNKAIVAPTEKDIDSLLQRNHTQLNNSQQQYTLISNTDTACDVNNKQQQQKLKQQIQVSQQQQQQATSPLAPINCTLSDLKKQRSDLRMRTTIIGAQTNNGTSQSAPTPTTGTTTSVAIAAKAANNSQQVVCVNPQPASLPVDLSTAVDALNGSRPESPGLTTFRKFRGEAGEVIGGRDRNNRRKCCILI